MPLDRSLKLRRGGYLRTSHFPPFVYRLRYSVSATGVVALTLNVRHTPRYVFSTAMDEDPT